MPLCRSCSRPIIWVLVAETGRRMPVDATPTQDGPVALDGPQGSARKVPPGEAFSGLRYTPHHATCPDGPNWRGQTREQLRLEGLETPAGRAPRASEGRPAPRRGSAAAAGYSATTTRAWQCPGCHQLRFGRACKTCREARPEPGRITRP